MRGRRIKVRGKSACYHCVTRTVNGEFLLDEVAREVLRKQLWVAAEFSGVDLLTYSILSNHFHVLVRVPEVAPEALSDAELMRRYRLLYPKPTRYQVARAEVLEATLRQGGTEAEQIRQGLLRRMHDLSEFMKTVKQRFSVWYNRSHQRYGTLWAERFKSVLVEGKPEALLTVALYLDLNPVRAGLVEDPKDYRFCGYGEAASGNAHALEGLVAIVGGEPQAALAAYRQGLFGKGAAPAPGKASSARISPEQAVEVIEQQRGRLPRAVALRLKVRYFSDGCVLGSKAFVQECLHQQGLGHRKAKGLKEGDWGELHCMRHLRREVFSVPKAGMGNG